MPRPYWKLESKEIDEWFKQQVQEFKVKENRSKRLTTKEWKNKYIFMEIYEIFFVTIAIEFQECSQGWSNFRSVGRTNGSHSRPPN